MNHAGHAGRSARSAPRARHSEFRAVPVVVLGLSLSAFLVISFVFCVIGYLLFPGLPIAHGALSLVLPGFQLLTGPSFFLGLFESAAWGWYIALVLGPLYNFFSARAR
jgi:hypothetical protein